VQFLKTNKGIIYFAETCRSKISDENLSESTFSKPMIPEIGFPNFVSHLLDVRFAESTLLV
jgi:hypothetical protein